MNKKTLKIIALVTGILLFIGAVGYFAFVRTPMPGFPLDVEQKWERFESNPIIVPQGKTFSLRGEKYAILGINDPSAMYDEEENKWKMWFGAGAIKFGTEGKNPGDVIVITMYAESEDGINWIVQEEPALETGTTGSWDFTNAETPSVVKDLAAPEERRYKLYYAGGAKSKTDLLGPFPIYRIGVAFSKDGKKFKKVSAAESPYGKEGMIFNAKDALSKYSFDIGVITDPNVVKKDGKFYMWASTIGMTNSLQPVITGIIFATSADGIRWKPSEDNIINLGVDGARNSVLWNREKQVFEMWYDGDTADEMKGSPHEEAFKKDESAVLGYWYAFSKDGINWQRLEKRVFGYDLTKPNENKALTAGPAVLLKNGTYYLFYGAMGTKSVPSGWSQSYIWAINGAKLP